MKKSTLKHSGFVFLFIPFLHVSTGCSDDTSNSSTDEDAGVNTNGNDAGTNSNHNDAGGEDVSEFICIPFTCQDYGHGCTYDSFCQEGLSCFEGQCDVCGTLPDGCGGELDCGQCSCEPVTCASLGIPCGVHHDGCGGEIDCGPCQGCDLYPTSCEDTEYPGYRVAQCGMANPNDCDPDYQVDCGVCYMQGHEATGCTNNKCTCNPDPQEPNDSMADAYDLGNFSDGDFNCIWPKGNLSSADDVDFYKLHVRDALNGDNPSIFITTSGYPAVATYWVECDEDTQPEECGVGETGDATGCRINFWYARPDCLDTIDDSLTLYIKVAFDRDDPTAVFPNPDLYGCIPYELRLRISDGGPSCGLTPGWEPFECGNGTQGVLLYDVCDHEDDCGDGSDEENCFDS